MAYFADGDSGSSADDEEDSTEQSELVPEQADAAEQDVSELTASFRGKLDRVRELTTTATLNSGFAFETALEVIEAQNDPPDEAVTQLATHAREYLREKDEGNDVSEQEASLREEMDSMLDRPDIAGAVTEGFQRRADRITELKRILAKTPLEVIAKVEADLNLERDTEISADILEDHQVNALLEELNIEPQVQLAIDSAGLTDEQKKAVEGVINSTTISREDVHNGKPTKQYKVRLIQRAVDAARQLAEIERKDIGADTTLSGTQELEEKFAKQTLHVRKHFERTLQHHASKLRERFNALGRQLGADAGSTKIEDIARHLGISTIDLEHRMTEVDDVLQRALRMSERDDGSDPAHLKKAADADFIQSAQDIQAKLTSLAWLESDDQTLQLKGFVGTSIASLKGAESWAASRAAMLQKTVERLSDNPYELEQMGELLLGRKPMPEDVQEMVQGLERHAEVSEKAKSGQLTPDDRDHLHDNLPEHRRKALDIALIAASSPGFMTQLRRDKRILEKDTSKNTDAVRRQAMADLREAEDALFENGAGSAAKMKILQHEVCSALPIVDQLSDLFVDTENKLRLAEKIGEPKGSALIRECRLNTEKLTKTATELGRLEAEGTGPGGLKDRVRSIPADRIAEYTEKSGTPESIACYHRQSSTIYINEQAIATAASAGKDPETLRQDAIYHEQGHAIVHMLMQRIGVLPGLMLAMHGTLAQEIPGDESNRSYDDLLMSRADAWGVELNRKNIQDFEEKKIRAEGFIKNDELAVATLARKRTDDQIHELMIDELANKFASWKESGKQKGTFSDEDLALFNHMDDEGKEPSAIGFDENAERAMPQEADTALQMLPGIPEDEDLTGDGIPGGDGGEGESGGKIEYRKTEDRIVDTENKLLMINEFIKNHQKVDGVENFEKWVEEWENHFEENIKTPFYEQVSGENSVDEDLVADRLQEMTNTFLEPAQEQIKGVTKAEMDETQSATSEHSIMGFLGSIEFVSINDIIGSVKSAGEDLQRMWKRRGERVQSILGQTVTDWIPDNNIWGLKYAGQLKHEFERRSNASELEEVKQWKDALENVDSFALIDLLATARGKDQLRAIIELLTEKGRLDWNNEKFWETLKRVSGLPMPIDACKNNSVLRDQWLQRMTTEIWDDKDKFYEWRQANDSNINSGKEKFTQVADQLSNISGGLADALGRQLKMWVENKGKGAGAVPEEVNPHLYEKLLHYAMSNGKMTMEDKMFYMVQGARHGLITVDRVQSLAGETGGVINQFPVIDYFNSNHNTLPELDALGKRIEESKNPFEPGQKTTIWMHLEVLRDKDAVMRMSKAMSGARTEALDHEDIPTLAGMADYKTVEELTGVLSGARFKISYEAVKNFYTGPGTKQKILARKAQLHQQGLARFTEEDAMEAAKTIVSYTHFDNIVTGNGADGKPRIPLTHAQIASQTGPSTGGHVVKDYRDPMHTFVQDVLDNAGINWGQGRLKNVDVSSYLSTPENEAKAIAEGDKGERARNNFNASGEIENQLKAAFLNNPSLIIEMLAKHGGGFKEEIYYDRMQKEDVQDFINTRRNAGKRSSATAP